MTGVCQNISNRDSDYTCECLGDSFYFGHHCEQKTKRIMLLQIVSTSINYIAIAVMSSTAMFIIIMDILKYCFDIDPVEGEREKIRRRRPVIQRFVYVNVLCSVQNKCQIS